MKREKYVTLGGALALALAVSPVLAAPVVTSGMPASAYVQDGLIAQWDGIENAGAGLHDGEATSWIELKQALATTATALTFDDNSAVFNGQSGDAGTLVTGSFPAALEAISNGTFTANACFKPNSYTQYTGLFNFGVNGSDRYFSLSADQCKAGGATSFIGAFQYKRNAWEAANGYSQTVAANGQMHSIAAVADGSKHRLYLGSAQTFSGNAGTYVKYASTAFQLGRYQTGDQRANMNLYGLRLYSRVLTAGEVAINASIDQIRYQNADPATLAWPDGTRWQDGKVQFRFKVVADVADGVLTVNGTTVPSGIYEAWYDLNATVPVTVAITPVSGKVFQNWQGDTGGLSASQVLSPNLNTVVRPRTLTAAVRTPIAKYWRGGTSTSASAAANWSDSAELGAAVSSAAPATGDLIVLDGANLTAQRAMTWDIDDVAPGSWTQNGYTNVVTFQTGFIGRTAEGVAKTVRGVPTEDGLRRILRVTGDVSVNTGSWKGTGQPKMNSTDAGWNDCRGIYRIEAEIGGDFTVGTAAEVHVIGQGFASNTSSGYRCGASHGGTGYTSSYKKSYGDVKNPTTIGAIACQPSGGAIILSVKGDARVDGALNASGARAATQWYGGAGGSVNLSAKTLTGAGRILADGTKATNYGQGGGGHIAVKLSAGDFTGFTGTYSAVGGYLKSTEAGACGTIYLEKASDNGAGELWLKGSGAELPPETRYFTDLRADSCTNFCDFSRIVITNGAWLGIGTGVTVRTSAIVGYEANVLGRGLFGTSVPLPDGVYLLGGTLCVPDGFTVSGLAVGARADGGAIVVGTNALGQAGTLTVGNGGSIIGDAMFSVTGNVRVASGGVVSHTFNYKSDWGWRVNMLVSGDLTIDEGGAINVEGKGLQRDATVGDNGQKSAHAGRGTQNGAQSCYGSVKRPTTLGGKGGSYTPYSAGAIRLTVSGKLTNDGDILANGYDDWTSPPVECGGGGSVWISAGKLLGSGKIHANGKQEQYAAGSGGGGRIALYLTDPASRFTDYAGHIEARGGNNAKWTTVYGAGSVYYHLASEDEAGGTLVIDGGSPSRTCMLTEFTTRVTDTSFDTVIITNGASVMQYQDTTITVRKDWLNYGTYAAENADADHAAGAVVFEDAAQTSRVIGTTSFAELSCATPGKRIEFGTGASDAVQINDAGTLSLRGGLPADEKIVLTPLGGAGTWKLAIGFGAKADLYGIAVSNCNSAAGLTPPVAEKSIDLGGNSADWKFVTIEPGETNVWNGGTGSGWTQPENWSRNRAPATTDTIVISGKAVTMPHLGDATTVNALTIESGATLSLDTYNLTVTNGLTVVGALVASSVENVTVSGDLSLAAGCFTCAQTTFTLTGDKPCTANFGNNALWRLVLDRSGVTTTVTGGFTADVVETTPVSAATVFEFASQVLVTSREWRMDGSSGDTPLITLKAVTSGQAWRFVASAYAYLSGLRVSDSNANGGPKVYVEYPALDDGNNMNWDFGSRSSQWNGSVSTAFDEPANWTPSGVPSATSRIVLGAGAHVTVPAEGATVRMVMVTGAATVDGGTLTLTGSYDVDGASLTNDAPTVVGGNFQVRNGGTVTHTQNKTSEGHRVNLTIAGDLQIDAGASIDAFGAGFTNGYGPGKGSTIQRPGSHGGRGSDGVCYGSIRRPQTSGSSNGGTGWATQGGGVVYLSVRGRTTVNGSIGATAKGYDWYGAAGGSVWLITGSLCGLGSISARGANVINSGLGGGGRVAVYLTDPNSTFEDYDGTIDAFGGTGANTRVGSCGTVFLATADTPADGGTLVIANDADRTVDGNGTDFPLVGEQDERQYAHLKLVLRDKASVKMYGPIRIGECEVSANSTLNLNGNALSIRSKLHRDRSKPLDPMGNFRADWPGTTDYSVPGSTILWHTYGLQLILR